MGILSDIASSGALGLGAKAVADNPKLLKGMGVIGNIAANKIENRADDKTAQAQRDAANRIRTSQGLPAMKKGGSVSSASKRADGIAQKGKTRGKIC